MLVAVWVTAVATVLLALFAVVTAWYARKAFHEQGEEVRMQREELNRAAADRRRLQASRVFVWQDVKPGEDAAEAYAMGPDAQKMTVEQWPSGDGNNPIWEIVIHVRNTSEQPMYEVALRWRTGSADWQGPERWPFLGPGEAEHSRFAAIPVGEPLDSGQLGAVVEFRDAAGVQWRRCLDGDLLEL